jgi:pimeloyl-ACP methyl ester carboxylesterase
VADLAALIKHLNAAPAHVTGNSFGGSIGLRLAALQPELLRSISAHEPPLFRLLEGDPKAAPALAEVQRRTGADIELVQRREDARAAELLVETALGPGVWSRLPEDQRQVMINNAPTFLDESGDPDRSTMDVAALRRFAGVVQLTQGDQSPPLFQAVIELLAGALPRSGWFTYRGSGHFPHTTDPEGYAEELTSFLQGVAMAPRSSSKKLPATMRITSKATHDVRPIPVRCCRRSDPGLCSYPSRKIAGGADEEPPIAPLSSR